MVLIFFHRYAANHNRGGFLDATPIQPGRLVDFILSRCTITDVIELALDYLESERGDASVPKRVTAVIHALFLAQHPQNLSFEKFQYLYMALDACFALVEAKDAKNDLFLMPDVFSGCVKNLVFLCLTGLRTAK